MVDQNGQPIGRVARALYDEGYSFDFISERQLGTLGAPDATRYTTIVVPGAVHMKVATLARFFALAEAGYRVLFVLIREDCFCPCRCRY